MVMGQDPVRLLQPQTVIYGPRDKSSVYLDTQLGVMLLGEVDTMNNNVRDLRPLTALSPNGEDNTYPKCFDTDVCTISEVLDNRGEIIQSKLENCTDRRSFRDSKWCAVKLC